MKQSWFSMTSMSSIAARLAARCARSPKAWRTNAGTPASAVTEITGALPSGETPPAAGAIWVVVDMDHWQYAAVRACAAAAGRPFDPAATTEGSTDDEDDDSADGF